MSSTVNQDTPSLLLGIPRECRHIIFSHAADVRGVKPRDTLRFWFEKQDVQEQIAEHLRNDPAANVTYVAGYNNVGEDADELEEEGDEEVAVVDDDDDDQDDDEDEYDQDDDEDEDENNEDDEDDEDNLAAEGEEHHFHEQDATNDVIAPDQTHNALQADDPSATTPVQGNAATPAPRVIVIKPHPKWRHIPKFMRLTQCPPQSNLFLVSKQLNSEVKAWFYSVATLKIDATASFLHFTFFELALTQLAEAAFSPMENIKKAEITFVWDTTWLRAEESGFTAAVFPAFLKNRVDFVLSILLRAPELESVVIHWHDSAQDDGAMQLRADTVEPFIMNLTVNVDIKDHYIEPEAKPRAKSRAGKQRLEFKAIVDNGCETF